MLVFLALSIWGHNVYKFFKGVKNADEISTPRPATAKFRSAEKNIETKKEVWIYDSKFRDPFKNWLVTKTPQKKSPRRKSVKTKKPNSRKSKPQAPKLRLTGIIKDRGGILAVIENMKQEIFFAEKGDSVGGVRIVSIDSSRIACEYKNQKFTLKIN